MPRVIPRVTKAQRAAVCGLILTGIHFVKACAIAGVAPAAMREALPEIWGRAPKVQRVRQYNAWKGKKLEELRAAYVDLSIDADAISTRFGIHRTYLYRLAVRNGWPRRKPKARVIARESIMTAEQRRLFEKFRRNNIPYEEAFAEAVR